jgi:hypothetical protein
VGSDEGINQINEGGREMKIQYVAKAVRWFDKANGNTYHSVRITRTEDKAVIVHPMTYGYGDSYKQTALEVMFKAGWIPNNYAKYVYAFERENEYPIEWIVTDGLKRDCIANGTL